MIILKEEGNFQEGALISVDKPLTWTSFDVVNKIRGCLKGVVGGNIKVGHAGTLDPLASGLVIVCVGKWTKQIDIYMGQEKEYLATVRFGGTTPSFDLETEVAGGFLYEHIDRALLDQVLPQFLGTIQQVPPAYSAVRIDGARAYKKARKGIDVAIQPREVSIRELEIRSYECPDLELKVACSKGTYIRSLANDLGVACGSGAHLAGLRRTAIGNFRVEDANKIDELIVHLRQMS